MLYKNPKFLGVSKFVSRYFAFHILFFFTLTTFFSQSIEARPVGSATVRYQDFFDKQQAEIIVDAVAEQCGLQLNESQRIALIKKVVVVLQEKESIESIVAQLIKELSTIQGVDKSQTENRQNSVVACSPQLNFNNREHIFFDHSKNAVLLNQLLLPTDIAYVEQLISYNHEPGLVFLGGGVNNDFNQTHFSYSEEPTQSPIQAYRNSDGISLSIKGHKVLHVPWIDAINFVRALPRLGRAALDWLRGTSIKARHAFVNQFTTKTADQFAQEFVEQMGLENANDASIYAGPIKLYTSEVKNYNSIELTAFTNYKNYQFPEYIQFLKRFSCYDRYIQELASLDNYYLKQIGESLVNQQQGYVETSFQEVVQELHSELLAEQECRVDSSTLNNQASMQQELHEIGEFYKEYLEAHGITSELEHVQDRRKALKNLNDRTISRRGYLLTSQTEKVLKQHNRNVDEYRLLDGTQLQHALHQEFIDHLNAFSAHPNQQSPGLLEFIDAGIAYNRNGFIDSAIAVSDFCCMALEWATTASKWLGNKAVNFGKYAYDHPVEMTMAAVEGALEGGLRVGHYMYENPVEAALFTTVGSVFGGQAIVAYYGCRLTHYITGIGYDYIAHDGLQWQEIQSYLGDMHEAIIEYEQTATPADVLRGATSVVSELAINHGLCLATDALISSTSVKVSEIIKKLPELKPIQLPKLTAAGVGTIEPQNKFERLVHFMEEVGKKKSRDMTFIDEQWAKQYEGAAKGVKGLIKKNRLPTKGKIRYVPPKNVTASTKDLPKGVLNGKRGIVDKWGNVWAKGGSRTPGQQLEWDLQLSKKGRGMLGWMSRGGKHVNVSMDGKVTH